VFGNDVDFRLIQSSVTFPINNINIFSSTYVSGDVTTSMQHNGIDLTEVDIAGGGSSIGGITRLYSIGRAGAFNGFHFIGKIAEVIIYDRKLTTLELTDITNDLKNKYGI